MKKRQINDEMMDSVLKTMLSEYQEEEGRKILKEAEELNKSDEYAPTKQQIKEFEKISKNRKHMDSAYCIFCDFNRSNRKTFPWLWRINQWKLSCFHTDCKKDFPGCYLRYTPLSSACRFHEYRRQPAACCFICFLEWCVQACHQKR